MAAVVIAMRSYPALVAPLVLVHGFTQNRKCWGSIAATLATGHEVIAVDVPGHGTASAECAPTSGRPPTLADTARARTSAIRWAPGWSRMSRSRTPTGSSDWSSSVALPASRTRPSERHASNGTTSSPFARARRPRRVPRTLARAALFATLPRSARDRRRAAREHRRRARVEPARSPAPVRRTRCGTACPSLEMPVLLVAGARDDSSRPRQSGWRLDRLERDAACDARRGPRVPPRAARVLGDRPRLVGSGHVAEGRSRAAPRRR